MEWGGHPRWHLGDLEGGGYPRWQIDGCAGIHDVEIWVSGWGGESGGKVTRSQLPVGCRIDDLDDPRARRSTITAPRGVSGVAQTGVSGVAQTGGVRGV